jgi:hypothetical protein
VHPALDGVLGSLFIPEGPAKPPVTVVCEFDRPVVLLDFIKEQIEAID